MLAYLIIFSLIWGSFLNVVAYRWINNQSIVKPRSRCTHCQIMIAWYDNIPIISWFLLQGKCRRCKNNISWLYPFIEVITLTVFVALYLLIPSHYLYGYFIFFSALIIITRTDLEYMLIMPEICLYPIIIAWLLSYIEYLPLSFLDSVMGTFIGYGILWTIAKAYFLITHKEGLGDGDSDVLALIGAFTGITGMLITLFIASALGSFLGTFYIIIHKQDSRTHLPFVPFLAIGALLYVLLQEHTILLLINHL